MLAVSERRAARETSESATSWVPAVIPIRVKRAMASGSNLFVIAGRSHYQIVLSDEERQELGHRAACYSRPHRDVRRAKLVLYAAEGLSNVEIGRRFSDAARGSSRARPGLLEKAGRVLDLYKGTPGMASGFSAAT